MLSMYFNLRTPTHLSQILRFFIKSSSCQDFDAIDRVERVQAHSRYAWISREIHNFDYFDYSYLSFLPFHHFHAPTVYQIYSF